MRRGEREKEEKRERRRRREREEGREQLSITSGCLWLCLAAHEVRQYKGQLTRISYRLAPGK